MRTLLSSLPLVFLASNVLAAGSSFSSTHVTRLVNNKPVETREYQGARIYSEDDKTFFIRIFGCEFRLQQPIAGDDPVANFVRNEKEENERKGVVRYLTRAIEARPLALDASSPEGFRCSDQLRLTQAFIGQTLGLVEFVAGSSGSGVPEPTLVLGVIQQEYTPKRYSDGTQGFYLGAAAHFQFKMKKDYFTPATEREAAQLAGDIGKAIFRAYLRSPQSRTEPASK